MTQKQIDALRVGDVVLRHNRNGTVSTRVLRARKDYLVTRGVHHIRTTYTFVKQARSRYPSPFTYLYPRELLDRRYVATGRRLRLTSKMDRKITRALTRDTELRTMTQNDVVGVVS